MINDLLRAINVRKAKLGTCMKADELSLEKRHQVYGALIELESITSMINDIKLHHPLKEKGSEEIFLFRPVQEKSFK